MPWVNKTGLAKSMTLLATLLLVSLGLCGVNLVAVMAVGDRLGRALSWISIIATGGLVLSVVGIAVVCLIGLIQMVFRALERKGR